LKDRFLNQSTTIESQPRTILVRFGGEIGNYLDSLYIRI